MSALSVKDWLTQFDQLSEREKRQMAVEIYQRLPDLDFPPATEDELAEEDGWADDIAACGFRIERGIQGDGSEDYTLVPLTEEEYLHPLEDYRLPNSTFHDQTIADLQGMLQRRYADDPTVQVFHDLIIQWDIRRLRHHSPDIAVVFGVTTQEEDRTRFYVAQEGVRPSLIIEVVSPRYRKTDRETKVVQYEAAGVQEYIIVDRRRQRGQMVYEVLGYELREGRYRPLTPDDQGRILSRTVGLWVSLHRGRVVLEDAATGERLLTGQEMEVRLRQEQTARQEAEARVQALEARLAALEAPFKRQGDGQ